MKKQIENMLYKSVNVFPVWLIGFGFVRHSTTYNMRGEIIKTEYSFYLPFIEIRVDKF